MRVIYYPDVDILDIVLKEGPVSESDELCEGVIADYDTEGHLIGLEVLDASERVTEPQNLVFESRGHASLTPRRGR